MNAYVLAKPEAREKLIFPDNWGMSAVEQFSDSRKPGQSDNTGEKFNRFYGDTWLLEQLSIRLGTRKDLMIIVFEGNWEIVNDILN